MSAETGPETGPESGSRGRVADVFRSHPVLGYTAARVGLFLAALVVLRLLGARGVLLLALGLIVSGLLSFFLLSGQRDRMSGAVIGRAERFRARLDEGAAAEDEDD